jgi:hypothetical protein
MGFNLDDYEPVALRLDRWLKQNPKGIVKTELLSQPGADICVFRAELWLEGQCVSVGHAEEIRGSNMINKTSSMEVCETSAIGRALANAGMAGSDMTKRPSREEMSKAASRGYLPRSTTAFPDSKTVHLPPSHPESIASANGVKVRGIQHGALPDWLVIEAVQAGVTEVYDNRADVLDNPKRPWFKATTGGKDAKAFWAPKGTPLPVIAMHEDDLEDDISQEEPF